MPTIRAIYHWYQPNFSATDQHPDAARYFVGNADSGVYDQAGWNAIVAAAEAAAKEAVYGTHDDAAIAEQMAAAPERRGALKAQLADERSKRAPVLRYAVDAIDGAPTLEQIDAMLDPPPAPPQV